VITPVAGMVITATGANGTVYTADDEQPGLLLVHGPGGDLHGDLWECASRATAA
jgi:hypothetical protein